jgi:hypothetical protein
MITRLGDQISRLTGARHVQQVVVAAPSVLEQAAYATPTLVFEAILTLLMAYFMIESRVRLRRRLLLDRSGSTPRCASRGRCAMSSSGLAPIC